MNNFIKLLILNLILFSFYKMNFAQTNISGVVNAYYEVNSISGNDVSIGSSAGVSHSLAVGDYVILIQMTGVEPVNGGSMGNYELLQVDGVSGSTITLSGITKSFDTGEKVQLVWAPYDVAGFNVTSDVNAMPWNGDLGGIIALKGGNLELNANIDATAAGFSQDEPPTSIISPGTGSGTGSTDGRGFDGGCIPQTGGGNGGAGIGGGAVDYYGKGTGGTVEYTPYQDGSLSANAFSNGYGGGGGVIGGGGGGGNNATMQDPNTACSGGGGGVYGGGGGGAAHDGDAEQHGGGGGGPGGVQNGLTTLIGDSGAGSGGGSYGGGGGTASANAGGDDSSAGGGGGSWTGGGISGMNADIFNQVAMGNGNAAVSSAIPDNRHYLNFSNPRIMMGGAGGWAGCYEHYDRGQGGGIVILEFNTVSGNNNYIRSNGDDPGITPECARWEQSDWGGVGGYGGGGGGQMVLNLKAFTSMTNIEARGGDAGTGQSGQGHGGTAGGGGGGGGVWIFDATMTTNSGGSFINLTNTNLQSLPTNNDAVRGGDVGDAIINPKNAVFTGTGGAGGTGLIVSGDTPEWEPLCSSSVTATPGSCDPNTNNYTITGQVTFDNDPGMGTITVSVDGQTDVINLPATSPVSYSISGLTADGSSHTVTVVFSDDAGCSSMVDYTAPTDCSPSCSVSQTYSTSCSDNSSPNDMDDYFDLTVTGTIMNGSGNYVVIVGGYTSPSTSSGSPVTIMGDGTHTSLAADGSSTYTVRVEDAGDSNCFVEFTAGPVQSCSTPSDTDWGDNPSTYGDLCIDINCGSPAHLGVIADGENGTQYSMEADGDDSDGVDDEDGVVFVGGDSFVPGMNKTITISWSTQDLNSYISGWIDFDGNGTFEASEKIIDDHEVGSCCGTVTGSRDFIISVPTDAACGMSYSRFLIASDVNGGPTGMLCGDPTCNDGEVEDYPLNIECPCPVNEHTICDDDSNEAVLTAESGYSNYIWFEYNEATMTKGAQVGTGQTFTVTGSDVGPAGSRRCYVYEADGIDGCPAELCCPVCVITEECCPTPNCYNVQVNIREN